MKPVITRLQAILFLSWTNSVPDRLEEMHRCLRDDSAFSCFPVYFDVTIQTNDVARRLNLEGAYLLNVSLENIELVDKDTKESIVVWPLHLLRKYVVNPFARLLLFSDCCGRKLTVVRAAASGACLTQPAFMRDVGSGSSSGCCHAERICSRGAVRHLLTHAAVRNHRPSIAPSTTRRSLYRRACVYTAPVAAENSSCALRCRYAQFSKTKYLFRFRQNLKLALSLQSFCVLVSNKIDFNAVVFFFLRRDLALLGELSCREPGGES